MNMLYKLASVAVTLRCDVASQTRLAGLALLVLGLLLSGCNEPNALGPMTSAGAGATAGTVAAPVDASISGGSAGSAGQSDEPQINVPPAAPMQTGEDRRAMPPAHHRALTPEGRQRLIDALR